MKQNGICLHVLDKKHYPTLNRMIHVAYNQLAYTQPPVIAANLQNQQDNMNEFRIM